MVHGDMVPTPSSNATPSSGPAQRAWTIRRVWDITLTVVLAFAAGIVIWTNFAKLSNRTAASGVTPFQTDELLDLGQHRQGSEAAPIALVVFSDFECPYCGIVARDVLPRIIDDYVKLGRVALAFRHFPSEYSHPTSIYAAEVAACAGNRFWEFHDLLFGREVKLNKNVVDGFVKQLGIDASTLSGCRETVGADTVDSDIATARSIGLRATPVTLVAIKTERGFQVTSRVDGAAPRRQFEASIEHAATLVASATRNRMP